MENMRGGQGRGEGRRGDGEGGGKRVIGVHVNSHNLCTCACKSGGMHIQGRQIFFQWLSLM